MKTIDLETSITDFLSLGQQLQSLKPLIGDRILKKLITWYRETRIIGTSLIDDGDMLLLQWGALRPLEITEPTDLRGIGDDKIKFSNSTFQYLNFTRQVFANYGDNNIEFDDVALQMRISFFMSQFQKKNWVQAYGLKPQSKLIVEKISFVQYLMSTC